MTNQELARDELGIELMKFAINPSARNFMNLQTAMLEYQASVYPEPSDAPFRKLDE